MVTSPGAEEARAHITHRGDWGARPSAGVGTGCSAQPRTHSHRQRTCPYLRAHCINRVTATHCSNTIYPQTAERFLTEQIFVHYTLTVPLTASSTTGRWINRCCTAEAAPQRPEAPLKASRSFSTGVTRGTYLQGTLLGGS